MSDTKKRLLIISPPYSYRIGPFINAARKLGIQTDIASAGDYSLVTRMQGGINIDYRNLESASQVLKKNIKRNGAYDGVIGTDDNTVMLASVIASHLGLPHNPPEAALRSHRKDLARNILHQRGLPVPEHRLLSFHEDYWRQIPEKFYPAVIKPLSLSASRGVMRVNDMMELRQYGERLRRIVVSEGPEPDREFLIERFIPGVEVAYEGLLSRGSLQTIALFDKPEPLDGPFFEETYYVTPSRHPQVLQQQIHDTVEQACRAYGLVEGAVHAELRIHDDTCWIIEVAARTIGGECGKSIRYDDQFGLEELVLAHATGMNLQLERSKEASGVMMIPIEKAGVLRRVEGILAAQKVPLIEEISVAIRPGNEVVPLPEGSSYMGFIFARGETPDAVEQALREAWSLLKFVIDPAWKAA